MRFLLVIALGLWPIGAIAQGPDEKAAEAAAVSFLQRLDQGDLSNVYESQMSPRFKSSVPQKQFVQQNGMFRIQTGGPAGSRQLVGGQLLDQLPTQPPVSGQFYYVRYRSNYPQGPVFQDVYMEKADSNWKVTGFWVLPAPK